MGWNPFKKKSWTDAGKAIVDTGKKAGDAIVDTGKKAGDAIVDTANTVANETVKAANTVANTAKDLANDTAKAVTHATATVESQTKEYAKQGLDVGSDAWKQGSQQVIKYANEGVQYVEYAAEEAYEWVDANACYIGLNMALTTGCVLYFTPKPEPAEPGTVTSTAISTTYLGYIAAKGSNTAMAMALGTIITDSLWLIPGIKGSVSKTTLQNVVTNVIATCNPVMLSVSLATPAGVGIFIGSVISPIVAQLVCERVAPKGFTKAVQ